MMKKEQTSANGSRPTPTGSQESDGTKDRIARSAHAGIDAASEAAHPTIDSAAEGAHRAVKNADEMADHAVEAMERAGVKRDEMITASSSYMRDHPLITLGLAVTTGYVLSRLLSSRQDKQPNS
ncbi:hypothetical protein E4656_11920 [Natronospirillum operosum]|uniref:DUF883 domain-containing protein n=1 Tax=Natronospirillum operosum TaxID=2759953 RepID=A0A4Z0W7W3_9GAMM|nr:hypothetical protein [Natronospirillum operosum]TGG92827.1 hypothetical protein E4656_11920 [Natronospirillum operosum]